MKRERKLPVMFRLHPQIVRRLRQHSRLTHISQTRIVELALVRYLGGKRLDGLFEFASPSPAGGPNGEGSAADMVSGESPERVPVFTS